MTAIWSYVLMIIGFALLIKGADVFVDGAASVARRFHISDLAIGLTVVAFGTSAPELFVNLYRRHPGNTDIAIGNVLGSNIANTLLILAQPLLFGRCRSPEERYGGDTSVQLRWRRSCSG